eukprot:SM000118S25592  [mRNA]  locus=s118:254981:258628:+ [translate_table: standard]
MARDGLLCCDSPPAMTGHVRGFTIFVLANLLCTAVPALASSGGGGYEVYREFSKWLDEVGIEGATPPNLRMLIFSPSEGLEGLSHLMSLEETARSDLSGTERGIVAAQDANIGDTILVVPFNSTIVLPEEYKPCGETVAWDVSISVALLEELHKGNKSSYAPFLRTFPRNVDVPWITLKPEEYKEAQFGPAISFMESWWTYTHNIHKLCNLSGETGGSYEQFAWAMAMASTRGFRLPVPDENGTIKVTPMFMPFGDLFNHHPAGLSHIEWEEKITHDKLELVVTRPIRKGEQIYDFYGERSTTSYYVEMGFVPADNPYNDVPIFTNYGELVNWVAENFLQVPELEQSEHSRLVRLASDVAKAYAEEDDSGLPVADYLEVEDRYMDAGGDDYASFEAVVETIESVIRDSDAEKLAEDGSEGADSQESPDEDDDALIVNAHKGAIDSRLKPAIMALAWALHLNESSSETYPWGDARLSQLAAYRTIALRLHQIMSAFPTTVQDDLDLLDRAKACKEQDEKSCTWLQDGKDALSEPIRLAITYRMTMKIDLAAVVALLHDKLAIIEEGAIKSESPLRHEEL